MLDTSLPKTPQSDIMETRYIELQYSIEKQGNAVTENEIIMYVDPEQVSPI